MDRRLAGHRNNFILHRLGPEGDHHGRSETLKQYRQERSQADAGRVDIASDRMGNNRLQGDDQSNVRNQRQAVPDIRDEADGVIESFQKMDEDAHARKNLGKSERTEN